jgi:hypothetical protein
MLIFRLGRNSATARSLLAGQDSRTDEWMYDFDEGGLAAHADTCLLTIGRPESSAAAFTDALRLLPPACERRGAEMTLTSLATFAARDSVAGLQRVRELRGTFLARGYVSTAAVIDEKARALGAVPV